MNINWYSLFKVSFRNRCDKISSRIVKEIFLIIKQQFQNKNIERLQKDILVDADCGLFLYIEKAQNSEELRYETFNIRGSSSFSKNKMYNPVVRIDVVLKDDFLKKDISYFYSVLDEVVRHEIEHYVLYKNGLDQEENMSNEYNSFIDACEVFKEHILSSVEIDPYIRGIMFAAKRQKVSFEKLLDEKIDGVLFKGSKEIKEKVLLSEYGKELASSIVEIKNKVIERTKQIFPDMR